MTPVTPDASTAWPSPAASPLFQAAVGAAMALAAWQREAHSWRLMALFFLLAGGLGGLVFGSGAPDPFIPLTLTHPQRFPCLAATCLTTSAPPTPTHPQHSPV